MSNIIAPTIDIHPGIKDVFDELDELARTRPENIGVVTEGCFGHQPERDTWVRPMDELNEVTTIETLRDDAELLRRHYFASWHYPNGAPIPLSERGEAFGVAEFTPIPDQVKRTQNAAYKTTSGYLFISRGVWCPVEETTLDGRPAFLFKTPRKLREEEEEREQAEERAFLEQHQQTINANRPAWASDITVYAPEGEIQFSTTIGIVEVTQELNVETSELTDPEIYLREREFVDADVAKQLILDLTAAVAVLTGALTEATR